MKDQYGLLKQFYDELMVRFRNVDPVLAHHDHLAEMFLLVAEPAVTRALIVGAAGDAPAPLSHGPELDGKLPTVAGTVFEADFNYRGQDVKGNHLPPARLRRRFMVQDTQYSLTYDPRQWHSPTLPARYWYVTHFTAQFDQSINADDIDSATVRIIAQPPAPEMRPHRPIV